MKECGCVWSCSILKAVCRAFVLEHHRPTPLFFVLLKRKKKTFECYCLSLCTVFYNLINPTQYAVLQLQATIFYLIFITQLHEKFKSSFFLFNYIYIILERNRYKIFKRKMLL